MLGNGWMLRSDCVSEFSSAGRAIACLARDGLCHHGAIVHCCILAHAAGRSSFSFPFSDGKALTAGLCHRLCGWMKNADEGGGSV